MARQLEALLDYMDYLETFPFGFRSGFRTKMALVTLMDHLDQEQEKRYVTLFSDYGPDILLLLLIAMCMTRLCFLACFFLWKEGQNRK